MSTQDDDINIVLYRVMLCEVSTGSKFLQPSLWQRAGELTKPWAKTVDVSCCSPQMTADPPTGCDGLCLHSAGGPWVWSSPAGATASLIYRWQLRAPLTLTEGAGRALFWQQWCLLFKSIWGHPHNCIYHSSYIEVVLYVVTDYFSECGMSKTDKSR